MVVHQPWTNASISVQIREIQSSMLYSNVGSNGATASRISKTSLFPIVQIQFLGVVRGKGVLRCIQSRLNFTKTFFKSTVLHMHNNSVDFHFHPLQLLRLLSGTTVCTYPENQWTKLQWHKRTTVYAVRIKRYYITLRFDINATST